MTGARALVLAFALAFVLAACGGGGDSDLDGAKAQVRTLFAAIDRGDCAVVRALLREATDDAACAKVVHEWRDEIHVRLVDVPDARRDGRDPNAIIVRTTVIRRGTQEELLVRVTHQGDAWRLAL